MIAVMVMVDNTDGYAVLGPALRVAESGPVEDKPGTT